MHFFFHLIQKHHTHARYSISTVVPHRIQRQTRQNMTDSLPVCSRPLQHLCCVAYSQRLHVRKKNKEKTETLLSATRSVTAPTFKLYRQKKKANAVNKNQHRPLVIPAGRYASSCVAYVLLQAHITPTPIPYTARSTAVTPPHLDDMKTHLGRVAVGGAVIPRPRVTLQGLLQVPSAAPRVNKQGTGTTSTHRPARRRPPTRKQQQKKTTRR